MARLDDLTARHLAKVIESSDDAIVSKDLNSIITSWNPGAERIFGYTAAEAIGKSIRMLIPANLQNEEDVVMSKIRSGDKVDHYETIRLRKDGTPLSISLTVSPIRDDAGTIIGASKIARDVTERARLLAQTSEYAANTQKLSEVGALVASTLDRETIVQKVTDTATELTHAEFGAFFYNVRDQESGDAYMLYALSGAPWEAFAHFPHPRATRVFAPTFRGEGIVRLDDVTQDPRYGHNAPFHGMPPGHLPVKSYLAVPVKGIDGAVLGGLFFGHSKPGVFTEQHERLAVGTAAWASVALENARLYGEVRDANRTKDDFLAVLSHELRTPLNAILGYSRLLRGGMLTGEHVDRALETVERNSRWLTQIVEDVLDVSRIVSGKIRLDVQPVEMAAVIENAVLTLQPGADAKGVKMHTLVDPRAGPVSGDPDRMQQVVWNLLSNAIKFANRGDRVQVRLERVDSHLELIVSDTGAGIRKDFLPFVFDRFRQGDAGPTRKTGGLGLGLSIVRHIVELHGGTVHADSAGPGQGSTFTVKLPMMAVQPVGDVAQARTPAGGAPLAARAALGFDGCERARGGRRRGRAGAVARRSGNRRREGHDGLVGVGRAENDRGPQSRRRRGRYRHARDRRLRADQTHPRVAEQRDQQCAGRGTDRVCALRRSHQGPAERLRDAPGQAGRSGRAGGVGRHAGAPQAHLPLTHELTRAPGKA